MRNHTTFGTSAMLTGTLISALLVNWPTPSTACTYSKEKDSIVNCKTRPGKGSGSTTSTTDPDEQKLLNDLRKLDPASLQNVLKSIKQ